MQIHRILLKTKAAERKVSKGKYKEYLVVGIQSKDPLRNFRNLFDDLNTEDTYWLKVTMTYIAQNF